MACLDEERVFGLVHGGLAGAELEGARAHLGECATCRILVAETARSTETEGTDVPGEVTTVAHPAGEAVEARALSEGDTVDGKYRIEGTLGRGGMGTVYAALHVPLKTHVAIKVLHASMLPRKDVVGRFQREARAAARIKGPHVVGVLDVGELPSGEPYIVMERLVGNDFAEELARRGRLSVQDAVDNAIDVCEAVAEAHAIGVVHRDLKPANLFLCKTSGAAPSVKVLDFGISKISDRNRDSAPEFSTEVHAWLGTPRYMAPEQITLGRRVDARADIWAIGTILFELVSGRPPFQDKSLDGLCRSILESGPQPLAGETGEKLPRGLELVVSRCLEKSPDRRFQTVGALARALGPYASPTKAATLARIALLPGMAPDATEVAGASRRPRRAPLLLGLALVLAALAGASLVRSRVTDRAAGAGAEDGTGREVPVAVAPPAGETPAQDLPSPSSGASSSAAPDPLPRHPVDRAPPTAAGGAVRRSPRPAPSVPPKHPEFGGRL